MHQNGVVMLRLLRGSAPDRSGRADSSGGTRLPFSRIAAQALRAPAGAGYRPRHELASAARGDARTAIPSSASSRCAPNLFEAWRDFAALFWTRRLVDPVVLELCRLRVAQLLGARYPQSVRTPQALAAGLHEARIAALADWWNSDDFNPTERACLRFAEQFVLDAKGITDADAAAVVVRAGRGRHRRLGRGARDLRRLLALLLQLRRGARARDPRRA